MAFYAYDTHKSKEHIQSLSDGALKRLEIILTERKGNIEKLVKWPALEASLARDIESIWQEQKRRSLNKSVK